MSIEKARKRAIFGAIASIFIGSVTMLAVVVVYALAGDWLNVLSEQASHVAACALLVKALKAAVFRVIPGLSIILIVSAANTLSYLRKQRT
ncbi:MAG: hypothetical protein HY299_22840 [Verrucomicrobia bacterium]|nr:hypothetical protein [Verrucomicrobiota bacterium]